MIAIIGGGISGLSLAYDLAQRGRHVAVYEKMDRLGGTCAWVDLDGHVVDSFYHVLTYGENALTRLLRDLGLEGDLFPVRTTMGLFCQGRTHPTSKGKDLLSLPVLPWRDRIRLGNGVLRAMLTRRWARLESITAREWLTRLCGPRVFDHIWRPIMAAKFGAAADRVVATDMWFRIHRLAATTVERSGACYLKGTLRAFFDALADQLKAMGVNTHTSRPIARVIEDRGRLQALELESGERLNVSTAVCTAPLPVLGALLPDGYGEYREALRRIEYLDNVCLILKTSHRITAYYQLNLADAGVPFTGLIGADCLCPPNAYGGYVTYVTRYFMGDDSVTQKSAQQLLEEYEPHLRRICPAFRREWVQAMTAVRGRHVEPFHTIGYADRIPAQVTPIRGLYLLSTSQIYPDPTILDTAVANAFRLGEQIASEGNR